MICSKCRKFQEKKRLKFSTLRGYIQPQLDTQKRRAQNTVDEESNKSETFTINYLILSVHSETGHCDVVLLITAVIQSVELSVGLKLKEKCSSRS